MVSAMEAIIFIKYINESLTSIAVKSVGFEFPFKTAIAKPLKYCCGKGVCTYIQGVSQKFVHKDFSALI